MLQKITGTTLYAQVMDQIKSLIVQGVYKKGDMLPSEKELMELTGVSRITVREALKSLAEVGMIETRQGKGSFVLVDAGALSPGTDSAGAREEYRERFLTSTRARLLVEPEIARLAAQNASDADIERMEVCLRRHASASGGESIFDDFHRAVAQAAGNALLLEFMDELLHSEAQGRSAFPLIFPEEQKRASGVLAEQHRRIFEAVRDGDGEFAYFYMKEHTRALLRSYEEYFQRFC